MILVYFSSCQSKTANFKEQARQIQAFIPASYGGGVSIGDDFWVILVVASWIKLHKK